MYKVDIDDQGTQEIWTEEQVVASIVWHVPEVLGDQTDDVGNPRFDEEQEIEDIKNADSERLMKEWEYYVGTAIEHFEP